MAYQRMKSVKEKNKVSSGDKVYVWAKEHGRWIFEKVHPGEKPSTEDDI